MPIDVRNNRARGDLNIARSAIVRTLRRECKMRDLGTDDFQALVRALEAVDQLLGNGPSITCPTCGWTSYHPEDRRQKYCGNCHKFHEWMKGSNDPNQ